MKLFKEYDSGLNADSDKIMENDEENDLSRVSRLLSHFRSQCKRLEVQLKDAKNRYT